MTTVISTDDNCHQATVTQGDAPRRGAPLSPARRHGGSGCHRAVAEHGVGDSGVGSWEPPGRIIRSCPGCGGGLQPNEPEGEPCGTCRWSAEHLASRSNPLTQEEA